jgi:hypothetical protein
MIARLISAYREHQARARLAELEAQTASGNASALARHGAAQRRREAKARQDETTARLRMEVRAGYVAHMRERANG